jgi:uncharacterized phage infection (PIP) family protein YhgE
MGYAVLHLEKTSGTDTAMSAHIERTINPKNADPERTYLNRELIEFPDGVHNRTQAIQHRLDNAGLQRKIGKNQVRAIRILLTGSNEDMKRIEAEGRLGDWCDDNLEWLRKTYGKENIDELLKKQTDTEKKLSQVKSEVSKEKFKNAKAEMGANLVEGVNSLFGNSKAKQQQAEIEELQSENTTLKDENRSLKTEMQTLQKEYTTTIDKLRAELKKVYEIYPKLRELLSIERMCRFVGFSDDLTKRILTGDKVSFKGSLYSAEYKQKFSTEHSVAQMEPEPKQPEKLRLTIDGVDIIEWFRLKYREFQRSVGIDWAERNVGRGRKI